MVRRALVQRRPWLLASLLVALLWLFFGQSDAVPGLYKFIWKGMPLVLLSIYAWRRSFGADGSILAAMLFVAGLSDMASELEYFAAGGVMAFSLLLAIVLYWRNRREHTTISQKLLSLVLVFCVPLLAWSLLVGEEGRTMVAGFALLLAIMAALAWTSRFSRYRVGAGAVLFVASELLLFAIEGPFLGASELLTGLVWALYYSGQLMIATGIVGRMHREVTG